MAPIDQALGSHGVVEYLLRARDSRGNRARRTPRVNMPKRDAEAAGLATEQRPPPPPPPLPAAGSRLGGTDGQKYELGELLGEGAFATVHRAKLVESGDAYAIKLIDKDGTDLEQAKRERDILDRIGLHKHIVGLFDCFEQPSNWVLVLELAEGGEVFDRICDGGPFSEADAASVVRQVVLALQHVHGLGVVHRDLKPENLLLVSQAAEAHVKVADFGLASLLGEPPGGEKNEVAGTITYMAPELLGPGALGEGALPVGPGLDVFSLGVILFNLVRSSPRTALTLTPAPNLILAQSLTQILVLIPTLILTLILSNPALGVPAL